MRLFFTLIVASPGGLAVEFVQDVALPSTGVGGFFPVAGWVPGPSPASKRA